MVFAARARAGARLVVYALHGRRGVAVAVRRLADGQLRPISYRRRGAARRSVPFWPAAFWGPAAVLAVVAVAHVAAACATGRRTSACRRSKNITASRNRCIDEVERSTSAPEGSWKVIGEVLASPSMWLLAIAYFPVKLARYSFYFWGPKYVDESLGTDAFDERASTAAWMPIGGMVGVIVTGYISDKLFQSRRAPVIVLSLLATAAVMLLGHIARSTTSGSCGVFLLRRRVPVSGPIR